MGNGFAVVQTEVHGECVRFDAAIEAVARVSGESAKMQDAAGQSPALLQNKGQEFIIGDISEIETGNAAAKQSMGG